ncbi:MAG: T9SS type A sorting domain-containing protein [Bacteroidia bacterium]|nr:T9SS type A sorting domain-containing protein [Bacteroidia bacterium]
MNRIRQISILLLIIVVNINSFASSVNASTFGWNATDATTAFVNAINSVNDTIFIDRQVSDWMINATNFYTLNNKTIIFENEVNLVAIPGAFSNIYASLMTLYECNNVKIIGYGATLKMQKSEYIALNNSEYRHCIQLISCNFIDVYGLKLMDSGGDGIIIASYTGITTQRYSENIFLKDLWCENNYRQGISVISAQHLRVENCWFTNTVGTAPQAGVDIEPNRPFERLVDIVFDKCRFTGNAGGGILIAPISIDSTTLPMDVTFNNCYVSNNGTNKYQISIYGYESGATGNIKFNNCMTDGGSYSVGGTKLASGYKANFNNCVFRNPTNIVVNFDDHTTSTSLIRNGGARFTNCLAFYNTNYRFFNVWHANATSAGLDDVQFDNFTVINPNTVTYNNGGNVSSNCYFDFQQFTAIPSTIISYTLGTSLIECNATNSLLNFSRNATSDTTFPIAMTYSIVDNGIQGFDYSRMKGFEIIPFAFFSQSDTLLVLPNNVVEPIKQNTITIDISSLYTSTSTAQNVIIEDCSAVGLNESPLENGLFLIYSNSASDNLFISYINNQTSKQNILIFNSIGQIVKKAELLQTDQINISDLSNGIYFVRLSNYPYLTRKFVKQ